MIREKLRVTPYKPLLSTRWNAYI